jgi:hypothetical protein
MSLVNKVLTKLRFSKNWNNKSDFPTYEMREEQVRADSQLLHDETQTAFNNLVDDLNSLSAENIPFESSTEVPAGNLQEAVENVQQQVAEASAATIPNGSITDEKLASGVPTNKADLVDGIVKADQMRLRFKELDTSTHALGLADVGHLLFVAAMFYPADKVSITIPTDSSDIPVGSVVMFTKRGYAADIQLVFDTENVMVYSGGLQYASPISVAEGSVGVLIKLSEDSWMFFA